MGEQSFSGIVIGTHNSMSYLPVKQWYLKPFNFIAKCQNKSILNQIDEFNYIDIRVCLINNVLHFAHGVITYKCDALKMLNIILRSIDSRKQFYVRIILEKVIKNKDVEFNWFHALCNTLKNNYPYITFFGGNYKKDWTQIYNFRTINEVFVTQYISSMQNDVRWYEKICPYFYAKRKNVDNQFNLKVGINLFDFI